jgi:hypothetical protein
LNVGFGIGRVQMRPRQRGGILFGRVFLHSIGRNDRLEAAVHAYLCLSTPHSLHALDDDRNDFQVLFGRQARRNTLFCGDQVTVFVPLELE